MNLTILVLKIPKHTHHIHQTISIDTLLCVLYVFVIFYAAKCGLFTLPERGYYYTDKDVQLMYHSNSNIQVACSNERLTSLKTLKTNGVAKCQNDGSWNDTFVCEGTVVKNHCIVLSWQISYSKFISDCVYTLLIH